MVADLEHIGMEGQAGGEQLKLFRHFRIPGKQEGRGAVIQAQADGIVIHVSEKFGGGKKGDAGTAEGQALARQRHGEIAHPLQHQLPEPQEDRVVEIVDRTVDQTRLTGAEGSREATYMIAVRMGCNEMVQTLQIQVTGENAVNEPGGCRWAAVDEHAFPVAQNEGGIPLPDIQKVDVQCSKRQGRQGEKTYKDEHKGNGALHRGLLSKV